MAWSGRFGTQTLVALVAVGGCFAAVAYAAIRAKPAADAQTRHPSGQGRTRHAHRQRPPRPRITSGPEAETTSAKTRFAFTDRRAGVRFECRLDRGAWKRCRAPVMARVGLGTHSFSVRAVDPRGVRSAAARRRWTRLQAMAFAIVPDLSGLGALLPGAPPVALPLTIENPNSEPISVTELRVSATGGPAGCASADNLALGQSNASATTPLAVPGHGSVRLPSQGIDPPTIQLRELPVNQDACQGARFPLEFSGSAHG